MNRTDTYGAFARLFLPQAGDPAPNELLRQMPGERDLVELLPDSLPGEHERVFGHSISKESPPYETSDAVAHVFMQSHDLADIAGFYGAFGLETRTGERLDHLAAELEFMQFLAAKETYAKEHAGAEEVAVCRDAQRAFLGEHLGRWVSALATRLRGPNVSPFYTRLAEEIADFVSKDCDALGVQPVAVNAAEMRLIEPDADGACGTCDLSKFQ